MDCIQVGAGPVQIVALHGIQGTRAAWLPPIVGGGEPRARGEGGTALDIVPVSP